MYVIFFFLIGGSITDKKSCGVRGRVQVALTSSYRAAGQMEANSTSSRIRQA